MSLMTKDKMMERIKSELGGSKVELEIDDEDISKYIDMAVDEIEPYVQDTHYITRKAENEIDLSDEDVVDIVRIYPNRPVVTSAEEMDLFRFRNYAEMQDRMTMPYRISQIEDFIDRNFKFDDDDQKLYIDDYHGEVTIEVIKELDLETMKDKDNINWVRKYATALTKMALGRVRGKYRVNDAPYETDADDLLSEGKEEKRELEEELDTKGFFYVTR